MAGRSYKVNNVTVEPWADGRGHDFISLQIDGAQIVDGMYGLQDASQNLSPEDAIVLGAALRKAGLKALKR